MGRLLPDGKQQAGYYNGHNPVRNASEYYKYQYL